jgi:hypothetical protein
MHRTSSTGTARLMVRKDDPPPFNRLYAQGAQSDRVMAIYLHPYLIGVGHHKPSASARPNSAPPAKNNTSG